MASIKRVSGNYDIYADLVTVHGNLSIAGNTTTINTEIVNQDEIITGNLTVNGPMVAVNSKGSPGQVLTSNGNGVFWSSLTGSAAGGNADNVQFNPGGGATFSVGSNNFNYFASNGNVQIGTTLIANNSILSTYNNTDLVLNANGTGHVKVNDVLMLTYQSGATPAHVSSTVQMLANTPGNGGTGLFVVNTSGSDELISKTKATILALIFS